MRRRTEDKYKVNFSRFINLFVSAISLSFYTYIFFIFIAHRHRYMDIFYMYIFFQLHIYKFLQNICAFFMSSYKVIFKWSVCRLYELGPRLTLQLTKIEEGVDEGEVLYHAYITKSASELIQLRKELPKKKLFLFYYANSKIKSFFDLPVMSEFGPQLSLHYHSD